MFERARFRPPTTALQPLRGLDIATSASADAREVAGENVRHHALGFDGVLARGVRGNPQSFETARTIDEEVTSDSRSGRVRRSRRCGAKGRGNVLTTGASSMSRNFERRAIDLVDKETFNRPQA